MASYKPQVKNSNGTMSDLDICAKYDGNGNQIDTTYAKTSDIPPTTNFVTLDGTQTISGVKTFSSTAIQMYGLRLKNTSAYGCKLNFGDGDYVYLEEPTDDTLKIHSKMVNFDGLSQGLKFNNSAGTAGQVLTSNGSSSAPTWQTPSSSGGGGTVLYVHHLFGYINNPADPQGNYMWTMDVLHPSSAAMSSMNLGELSGFDGFDPYPFSSFIIPVDNEYNNRYFLVRQSSYPQCYLMYIGSSGNVQQMDITFDSDVFVDYDSVEEFWYQY